MDAGGKERWMGPGESVSGKAEQGSQGDASRQLAPLALQETYVILTSSTGFEGVTGILKAAIPRC